MGVREGRRVGSSVEHMAVALKSSGDLFRLCLLEALYKKSTYRTPNWQCPAPAPPDPPPNPPTPQEAIDIFCPSPLFFCKGCCYSTLHPLPSHSSIHPSTHSPIHHFFPHPLTRSKRSKLSATTSRYFKAPFWKLNPHFFVLLKKNSFFVTKAHVLLFFCKTFVCFF